MSVGNQSNQISNSEKDIESEIRDKISSQGLHFNNQSEGEELEIDEYQHERLLTGHVSQEQSLEQSSAAQFVTNFKLRRRMHTMITDFYANFDHKFAPTHPYIQVKNDAMRARATLDNIHTKRDNINHSISEEVAMNILNQENNLLWENMKKLNKGLTVIIDEYNKSKMNQKEHKRQAKLRRQGEELLKKQYLMKHELDNKTKLITNLTTEKMSLEAKINRMKQSNYKEELTDIIAKLKSNIESLQAKNK